MNRRPPPRFRRVSRCRQSVRSRQDGPARPETTGPMQVTPRAWQRCASACKGSLPPASEDRGSHVSSTWNFLRRLRCFCDRSTRDHDRVPCPRIDVKSVRRVLEHVATSAAHSQIEQHYHHADGHGHGDDGARIPPSCRLQALGGIAQGGTERRGKQAAPSGPGATLKLMRWRGPSTNRAMWSVGQ